jgi:hypothetical protein
MTYLEMTVHGLWYNDCVSQPISDTCTATHAVQVQVYALSDQPTCESTSRALKDNSVER